MSTPFFLNADHPLPLRIWATSRPATQAQTSVIPSFDAAPTYAKGFGDLAMPPDIAVVGDEAGFNDCGPGPGC